MAYGSSTTWWIIKRAQSGSLGVLTEPTTDLLTGHFSFEQPVDQAVTVRAKALEIFQLGAVRAAHILHLNSMMVHFNARFAMLSLIKDYRVDSASFAEQLSTMSPSELILFCPSQPVASLLFYVLNQPLASLCPLEFA